MPSFNILREVTAPDSFRVNALLSKFDLQSSHVKEEFRGEIPIEGEDWNIGIIYGRSGTGKSTIAKELFPNGYIRGFGYKSKNILDDMPESCSTTEIFRIFNSVGFSSPPSWLKPFSCLSTGEKMRVDLARAILEQKDFIVFDEFTSVVNREIARVGSAAIAKAIRRMNKRFIAVSCHEDIIPWLEPDWTFCTNTMTFEKKTLNARQLSYKSTNAQEAFGIPFANITI